jgi:NTP pyrophosphatase (non-canonical NTP hydrolase)
MDINLPEVNWQSHNWTIPGQLKKLFEEAGEVAEAVALSDPVNTIREALDTMQTCATLISMVQADYNLALEKFVREHREKLGRKGYLCTSNQPPSQE